MLATIALAGCVRPTSMGPRTIPGARLDYNQAISRSWDEDLLLNLVRLRYRDSPLFLDVTSITASYTLSRTASLEAGASGRGLAVPEVTGSLGLSFGENPIVSYSYLRGEEFALRLLSPLQPTTLQVLAQSGWSIERLMLCCVQSINGVENAVAAAGPTPDAAPEFESFQRAAALFRKLQVARQVVAEQDAEGRTMLYLSPSAGADGDELRRLLSLDREADRFEVVSSRRRGAPTQVAMQGRSLLAVMYFLSQGVEAPGDDSQAGRVTVTHDAAGQPFDWARVVGRLVRIRSGDEAPAAPAVRVRYREHWFWIEDNDLNSKTTFALLRLLLFLKSGERQVAAPLVTIPVR